MLDQNKTYITLLESLKTEIQRSQIRAALAVTKEVIEFYWRMGKHLEETTRAQQWGSDILAKIAQDLQKAYPGLEGFSKRSLHRMRLFYRSYESHPEFLSQVATKLPWFQNVVIFEKLKTHEMRLWYAQKTLEHGWSKLEAELERLATKTGKTA